MTFNSYMVAGFISLKDEDGSHLERTVPTFFLRDDAGTAPRTAIEAARQALKVLEVTMGPSTSVTAISISVGSLDKREDTYSIRKTYPSGRITGH